MELANLGVSVRLTLTNEGERFSADLAFSLKDQDFHAKEEHLKPDGAAGMVAENIERQLRRYKDRVKDHRGRAEGMSLGRAMPGADEGGVEGAVVEGTYRLRELTVDEALESFRDAEFPFLVFRNAESGDVSVVYGREAGEIGLLKPEAGPE